MYGNNSAHTYDWQGAPRIPQDEWAFVAIAIQPEKATSYVYHTATDTHETAVNEIEHIQQTVMNLKFGWDECRGARYFRGVIDEVMIYNLILNADEIKKLATIAVSVESTEKLAITWQH